MKNSFVLTISACLLFAACTGSNDSDEDTTTTPPVRDVTPPVEEVVPETNNVTYTGKIQPAGISIYQEGTHRLVLDDGRFILLESDDVDLNGYVNETVEVFGAMRPTVEEGGMIMRVENISLLQEEDPLEDADPEDKYNEENDNGSTGDDDKPLDKEGSDSSEAEYVDGDDEEPTDADNSSEEDLDTDPTAADDEEEDTVELSAGMESTINIMADDNYASDRWSQEYCSAHIGFCIPIHKNWWYKSFGNTTSHLWHVELSYQEVEIIGDGPIVVKLIPGELSSMGGTDGEVKTTGSTAIGFLEWTDGTHFEIEADARLVEAVRYLTEQLSTFEE